MSGAADEIDFDAAERFLKTAKEAKESGDERLCTAACKMVAIALNLTDSPRARLQPGQVNGA